MKQKSTIVSLFILGVMVLAYPHISTMINDYLQSEKVSQFYETEVPSEIIEEAKTCNKRIFTDAESFRDPFSANVNNGIGKVQKCFSLTDGEIFAALEIPKLGLSLPIYLGATDDILDKGVGQVEGSSLPVGEINTHTVLAGHRNMSTQTMFRHLDQLQPGEIFYIHIGKEKLAYQVYEQQVIYPHETESLEIVQGKDLATLITCHPYRYTHQRLLVHAERIETK